MLDSDAEIKDFDKGQILGSIRALPAQIKQAWREVQSLKLPEKYSGAENIVICGMGGSALGGRVVDALFSNSIRGPLEVYTGYNVPIYASEKSLVVLSSYSGGTEETINCFYEALERKSLVFGITSGGKLGELLREKNLPGYIFNASQNPSGQPRMGLGYAIAALLALLNKTGFITLADDEMETAIAFAEKMVREYGEEVKEAENPAKSLATKLFAKIPVLISSEHLIGISHAFKNQINENAKTMALGFDIPELNHHLMEGLKNPAHSRDLFCFLFLASSLYHERVSVRYGLTEEVVEKNGYPYSVYPTRAETKLAEIFEILALGSYVSFYLAYLYKEDASKIPWVDYFKAKLAKG